MQSYLTEMGVKHFETQNEPKTSYAERAILTIKTRLTRYMTYKQTHKWVDILDAVTNGYNNTYHRSIKQSPASYKDKDEVYQWQLQYDTLPKQKRIRTRAPHSRYRFKIRTESKSLILEKTFSETTRRTLEQGDLPHYNPLHEIGVFRNIRFKIIPAKP